MITLLARPQDDLEWEVDDTEEEFFLDLGLSHFDPVDPAIFSAHALAVEEFSRKFPRAKKVYLASLKGPFSALFQLSDPDCSEMDYANLFSEYLHRLAALLPDEATPVLRWDLRGETRLEDWILLFSRRRFEHFELQFIGPELPIEGEAPIMVALPQDELFHSEQFSSLLNHLEGSTYKCIPEEFLNEHWEGVDHLIVDLNTLGGMGKRMLEGFEAAGGGIITLCGTGGYENEISLKTFLTKRVR